MPITPVFYSFKFYSRYLSPDGSITIMNDSLASLLKDPLFTASILQRFDILYVSSHCIVDMKTILDL